MVYDDNIQDDLMMKKVVKNLCKKKNHSTHNFEVASGSIINRIEPNLSKSFTFYISY